MLKTVSSISNVIGALNYKGTWNANSNVPVLSSGVGTKGDYYVVSTAGSTNLDGTTLWGVGDWAVFNGSIWQKVDGGDTSAVTSLTVTGLTGYMYANNTSPVTSSLTIPVSNVAGAVPNTVYVIAGTGLSGGGALTGNVTFNISNTTVTLGSYGSANTVPTYTVNAQGQLTAASNTSIAIDAAAITTGTLAVARGGTNIASYTIGDLIYASGTTTLAKLADVATGSVFVSGGIGVAPSWSTSPTVTTINYTTAVGVTSETVPLVIGGTTASSTLTLESTSGAGTTDAILFKTGSQSTRMTINTNGNVGIGTSSPSDRLQIATSAAGNNFIRFYQTGVHECWVGQKSGVSALIFGTGANYTTELMRIDSSGTVFINQTATTGNGGLFQVSSSTNNAGQFTVTTTTYPIVASQNGSGSGLIYFNYNATNIGTITTNGTTTSYNITSDYRLKNTVIPMTNGLNTVSALKPVTYKWNADNSDGDGFIAHELQSIVPAAVVGEKDAVDADGKPIYQGVDYSKIVVHLVAAIQELSAKNDVLEARLSQLEAK